MDNALLNTIVQLIVGAIGGNLAGAALKEQSLGPLGNTIAGVVGGGLGGQILSGLTGGAAGGTGLVGSLAGSGVGGAVLMLLIGVVKKAVVK